MKVKLFGDPNPINWEYLGVNMPFAPMHKLAKKYEDRLCNDPYSYIAYYKNPTDKNFKQTFQLSSEKCLVAHSVLCDRIDLRASNTIAALDKCTSDTVCINLGGGYHHAGKHPEDGYAYSLINDIIWAVDRQLANNKTIGIVDLDFHFGGGTYDYYLGHPKVQLFDSFHPKGLLHKHAHLLAPEISYSSGLEDLDLCAPPMKLKEFQKDKIILNLGTDWLFLDPMFGQYGQMMPSDLLDMWRYTITQIAVLNIPLAITMGGGYGDVGLQLYEDLISWLEQL